MGIDSSSFVVIGRVCRYLLRILSLHVGSVARRRIGVRDALRDESRHSSLLKVTFPAHEIGEPMLVGKLSSGQGDELLLEIVQSFKVDSPGVALAP
jgi:hypothetical protein